ncbi:proline-rich transmembrane protein 4-like isoform X2 [Asterias rubens]|uniref:proline-rich transmembrane protein 4-like isoform X1 n=1 Tax=Asterias rubens TaxID=7604 RepID=UPI0014552010|nr:proline-rich transmembrane protein 4-like isoform X1 [Asterias rubens]XP_033646724.1 proline-rich transmembrane protein 4-like isoform X2 [Asterias rubens]
MALRNFHLVIFLTCIVCLHVCAADTTNAAADQTGTEPTSEPTTELEPEPTSEPTPEPEPEPTSNHPPESAEPTSPEPEPSGELTSPEPEPSGEPSSEPEPKPSGEPTSEPEPEPSGEPSSEPEPEPSGEPSSEPEPDTTELPPFAEPVPDWKIALPLYGYFWYVHIYILGSLFALLALYSLVSLIRLRKRRLLSMGYFVALNLMMLVMGVDRAVYLFVDAYNHKQIFPLPVAYMLLGMGFPCLSSAFSILFLALLNSTKTQLVSRKVQGPKALSAMITFHFTISILVDVIVGLFTKAQVLLLLCQAVFLIWGLFLSVSYLVIFRRLHISSLRQFRELNRLSMTKRTTSLYGISPFMKKPRNNWSSAIKVTLLTSFFGVTIGLLQLYGILVVYGPLGEKVPEPWSWVWYQLAFRICEFAMCALMSYVATQPFRYTVSGKEKPMCMECTKCMCCNVITGKTSHDLNAHSVDSYRLVSGDFDASATFQANDYNPTTNAMQVQQGKPVQTETLPLASGSPQSSPTGFYPRGVSLPLDDSMSTFKPQTLHSNNADDKMADNTKNNLALKMPKQSTSFKETNNAAPLPKKVSIPASAPVISTQDPFKDNMCTVITDMFPGENISSKNKNNHHSCPSTPLQESSPSSKARGFPQRLSLSSLQLDDKTASSAPERNEEAEVSSKNPDTKENSTEQMSKIQTDEQILNRAEQDENDIVYV